MSTIGLWLPILLLVACMRESVRKSFADYRVEIASGRLTAGTAKNSRTIPLDSISDVATTNGYLSVSVRARQALQILGLRG